MKNRILQASLSGLMLLSTAAVSMPSAVMASSELASDAAATIKVNSQDSSAAFKAWKIFGGRLSGNTMSDIEYATGVTEAMLKTAIKAAGGSDAEINALSGAPAVAKYIADNKASLDSNLLGKSLYDSIGGSGGIALTRNEATEVGTTGWYLVADTQSGNGASEVKSAVLLEVADAADINAKDGTVPFDKKIVVGANNEVEHKDVAKGDAVPYVLKSALPKNYDKFTTFEMKFMDTLDAGLTAPAAETIHVSIGGVDITDKLAAGSILVDGQNITVDLGDVKLLETAPNHFANEAEVKVEYSATVKDDAVMGTAGNKNAAKVIYSNDPTSDSRGESVEKNTKVYTYELKVFKIKEDGQTALAGATFKLDGPDGYSKTIQGTSSNIFEFDHLEPGEYTLTETKAPEGYNLLGGPITITISTNTAATTAPTTVTYTRSDAGAEPASCDAASGICELRVMNQPGVILPSAGGMGTKIIYVAGAGLILAATAVAVGKKKKASE